MAFILFISFIILQRITELIIARKNEAWMKNRGALEFGRGHYRVMVLIHTSFFMVYIFEVVTLNKELSSWWPLLLPLFLLTQGARVWALTSLGKFWNTKIIVLPNAEVVAKGPYRFIKHPNYVIVALEFIIIPFMFKAYITAITFSILNLMILSIRIPEEERALKTLTEYEKTFNNNSSFFPKVLKKYDN
ncbi:isoprenylcysteine carboxyl methyltransferase family protein [Mesobacillus harenae]|uniref:isoprenylcysteine carboxyl methyltransferase family protein n=1 Tax=Mesobacillus harenae TaxID=2213203 RepID=UPI0015809CDA|nr:isoprenylcysteine carboxylmethyltransferase family protein [Mesobacillus harenae]